MANWTGIAGAALGFAVMLGAFGAHGLRGKLDAYSMGVYERAVLYHFIHALGLLVVSALPKLGVITESAGTWICALLAAGIVIFSGSLYVLAISGVRTFGAITPIGGLAFIAGWLLLALAAFRGAR